MPSLDSCINNLYEPGNIPATSGQPPDDPVASDALALDFSFTQNSQYFFLLIAW